MCVHVVSLTLKVLFNVWNSYVSTICISSLIMFPSWHRLVQLIIATYNALKSNMFLSNGPLKIRWLMNQKKIFLSLAFVQQDGTGWQNIAKNFPVKDKLQSHKVPAVPELCDMYSTWHVCSREDVCTCVRCWKLRESDHLQDIIIEGRIILKWIWNKSVWRKKTVLIWLTIGANGRLFWTRSWFFPP